MEEVTQLSEAVWRLQRIKHTTEAEERRQQRQEQLFEQFFGVRKEAAERSKIDRAYTYLVRALEHGRRADDPRFLAEDLEIEDGRKTLRERRLEEYGAALRDLHTVWKIKPETPFLQRKRLNYTHAVLDLMESAEQKGNIREYQTGVHALQYREGSWDLLKAYVLRDMKRGERASRELPRPRQTYLTMQELTDKLSFSTAWEKLTTAPQEQEGEQRELVEEFVRERNPIILSGAYVQLNRIPELGSLGEPNYRPLKFNKDGEIVFGMEVVPELPEGAVPRERALEKPYDVLFAQEVAP